MTGPKTHHIFYKQLKQYLNKDILDNLPHYDEYSIFAQGHDLLIYYDFYKIYSNKRLEVNLHYSELLQEFYFPEFIYNYIKHAQKIGTLHNEQIRLFLYGYIGHHILDAYTHPFIIYYSGDHMREPQNPTWWHGIVENLIDIYLMEKEEHINPQIYPVYKDFTFSRNKLISILQEVLNDSLQEIYGFKGGGEDFCKAMTQIGLFIRIFKYDSTGIKRVFFDKVDTLLKGTASFSYHRNNAEVLPFLNENHELWRNPMNGNITSYKSFWELYQSALKDTAEIINQLEGILNNKIIDKDIIYSIIPNIASTHGLKCGQKLEINHKKQWN